MTAVIPFLLFLVGSYRYTGLQLKLRRSVSLDSLN